MKDNQKIVVTLVTCHSVALSTDFFHDKSTFGILKTHALWGDARFVVKAVEKSGKQLKLTGYNLADSEKKQRDIFAFTNTNQLISDIWIYESNSENSNMATCRSAESIAGKNRTVGEVASMIFDWLVDFLVGKSMPAVNKNETPQLQTSTPNKKEEETVVVEKEKKCLFSKDFVVTIQSKTDETKSHHGTPTKYEYVDDKLTLVRKDGGVVTVKTTNYFIKYIRITIASFKIFKRVYADTKESQSQAVNAVRYRVEKIENSRPKETSKKETSITVNDPDADSYDQIAGLGYMGCMSAAAYYKNKNAYRNNYNQDYSTYNYNKTNGPMFMEKE
jgi:hypothetical protein